MATAVTARSRTAEQLGAALFALVGMLEAAMTNAAHEGEQNTLYTLNQLHSYDWRLRRC
jgi:hypothetical protein